MGTTCEFNLILLDSVVFHILVIVVLTYINVREYRMEQSKIDNTEKLAT